MRIALLAALAAFTLQSLPALAREPDSRREPARPVTSKPVTSKDVRAGDVVATPLADLNLKKGDIPPLLFAAVQRTYGLQGLGNCQQIAEAIGELDALLGDDLDLPQPGGRHTSPGQVAQYAVGSFIPFRDVIREVSGASRHDREFQSAVIAGMVRRAFLKGIGQARGCSYPARSATLAVFNQRLAQLNAQHDSSQDRKSGATERQVEHR